MLTSEAAHRVRQRTPHAPVVADLQPCLVHVDPAGVDHAICNLIDNAIEWNPSDGAVHVVVADAHVSVTDHGPGIPDEDLPRIFERCSGAADEPCGARHWVRPPGQPGGRPVWADGYPNWPGW